MTTPPETVEVDTTTVACDGNSNEPGHPRVFLNMEGAGEIQCPYCSRVFVLKPGAKVSSSGH